MIQLNGRCNTMSDKCFAEVHDRIARIFSLRPPLSLTIKKAPETSFPLGKAHDIPDGMA